MDRDRERLTPSAEERLRSANEARDHPDYPNPYDPEREQIRDAQAATARRLAREEAFVNTGLVAGHDFKREAAEREWERER